MSDLEVIAAALVAGAKEGAVTLENVVEAIGARAVSFEEVDEIFRRVEKAGVVISAPRGGKSEGLLGRVLKAARALRERHGRVPSYVEIADEAKMKVAEVELAMAFARVVQR